MPTRSAASRAPAVDYRPLRRNSTGLAITSLLLVGLSGCFPLTEHTIATPAPTGSAVPTPTSTPTPTNEPIVDSGPREGAQGTAEVLPDGTIRYTVVSGDVGGLICDRFGRNYWQLNTTDNEGGFDCYSMVYVDDVLIVNNDRKPL